MFYCCTKCRQRPALPAVRLFSIALVAVAPVRVFCARKRRAHEQHNAFELEVAKSDDVTNSFIETASEVVDEQPNLAGEPPLADELTTTAGMISQEAAPAGAAIPATTTTTTTTATTTTTMTKPVMKREIYVQITRSGNELLGIVISANDTTLLVEEVVDGLVKEWNHANPEAQIDAGDHIVGVNGETGNVDKMRSELRSKSSLIIKVVKKKLEEDVSANGSVFRHRSIGMYLAEDLEGIEEEVRLLLMVQRDIFRLVRLRRLDANIFRKKFPADYPERKLSYSLGEKGVGLVLTGIGFGDIGSVWQLVDNIAGKAISYGNFAAWLVRYAQSQSEDNERLVKMGGAAPSTYWSDVDLGTLWGIYHTINLIQRSWRNIAPTTLRNVTLDKLPKDSTPLESACAGTEPVAELPMGTILRSMSGGGECAKVRLANGSDVVDGLLPMTSIAKRGWYLSQGMGLFSRGIPIQMKPVESNEDIVDRGPMVDYVKKNQPFTVVRKVTTTAGEFWKLGDGRGWILVTEQVRAALQGPMGPPELQRLEEFYETALRPVAYGTARSQAVAEAADAYGSTRSTLGRQGLKFSLFVGGFFTGGLTWGVLTGVGITDAVAGATLAGSQSAIVNNRVAYVMAALSRFEHSLFTGKLGYKRCDRRVEGVCADEEVCLSAGVFHHLTGGSGRCVPAARPTLPLGSFCVLDIDCKSGAFCRFTSDETATPEQNSALLQNSVLKDESLVTQLGGVCTAYTEAKEQGSSSRLKEAFAAFRRKAE